MAEEIKLLKERIKKLENENAILTEEQIEISEAKELYLKNFEEFPALIWRSRLDKLCDGYNIQDGKVKIDLRFYRPADTTDINYPIRMEDFIKLYAGGSYQPGYYEKPGLTKVPYSCKWLENGRVLSILTDKTKESFCSGFPCYLYLRFHFGWRGATFFEGIADKNGIQLDTDKNGFEMGVFILKN